MHVWECPCSVLDSRVQDRKKLPRWQHKSRCGQFLERSKRHASTFGLIKNMSTGGLVLAQFHVVYDDWFATFPPTIKPVDLTVPDEWVDLLTFTREKIDDDPDHALPQLADEWLDQREKSEHWRQLQIHNQVRNQLPVPERRQEQVLPVDGDQNAVLLPIQVDDDLDDKEDEPAIVHLHMRQQEGQTGPEGKI
jgi:hypothetical protein